MIEDPSSLLHFRESALPVTVKGLMDGLLAQVFR